MNIFEIVFLLFLFILLACVIFLIQYAESVTRPAIITSILSMLILFSIVGAFAHALGVKDGHIMMYENKPVYEQIIFYDEDGEPIKIEYKLIKED